MLATLVLIVAIAFSGSDNFGHMFRYSKIIRNQKRQIVKYDRAIDEVGRRIGQLTSNKDTLEMFARENYYFLEDGEDVFIVEEE
ncbi:MAG: septum formation initiator family protein [Bacteroidales bacterium]|nr:septum formation initiator family protein [Bacteroidales bacterium]